MDNQFSLLKKNLKSIGITLKPATKQDKAESKLLRNEYVWFHYGYPGDGYTASAGIDQTIDGPEYFISYHKDEMPPFNTEVFLTVETLAARCLEIQPDMRKWRTKSDD